MIDPGNGVVIGREATLSRTAVGVTDESSERGRISGKSRPHADDKRERGREH
jgi:hypothetical protein